jgi:hypothetical protein
LTPPRLLGRCRTHARPPRSGAGSNTATRCVADPGAVLAATQPHALPSSSSPEQHVPGTPQASTPAGHVLQARTRSPLRNARIPQTPLFAGVMRPQTAIAGTLLSLQPSGHLFCIIPSPHGAAASAMTSRPPHCCHARALPLLQPSGKFHADVSFCAPQLQPTQIMTQPQC